MSVNDDDVRPRVADFRGMIEYQPLLNDLLVTRDNLRHRILFDYRRYEYVVPCEIVVEPERRAIAIVASTTYRLPKYRVSAATAIAAVSCSDGLPEVFVDGSAGRVMAIFPIAVEDIGNGRCVDLAVEFTALRLMAVVRRINLNAGGLSIETVAAISELELARMLVPFRSYRPFKAAE